MGDEIRTAEVAVGTFMIEGVFMTAKALASTIEHTLLRAEATAGEVERLCAEAEEHGFRAVCVNPAWVSLAAKRLDGSGVRVVTVAGFPLGASLSVMKAEEARRAVGEGAAEVDMVAPLGLLRAGERAAVRDDIWSVVEVVHGASGGPGTGAEIGRLVKVILETAALEREAVVLGCRCAAEAEADFVKTSTGFHPAGGATVEAVELLVKTASPLRVKAAGGIRDPATARRMLAAGASRLGTSAGSALMEELATGG